MSKLTKVSVRRAIADAAAVCEANVTKVESLLQLDALFRTPRTGSKSLLPVVFDLLQQKMSPKPNRLGYAQDLYRTFGTPLIGRDGYPLMWIGRLEAVLSV